MSEFGGDGSGGGDVGGSEVSEAPATESTSDISDTGGESSVDTQQEVDTASDDSGFDNSEVPEYEEDEGALEESSTDASSEENETGLDAENDDGVQDLDEGSSDLQAEENETDDDSSIENGVGFDENETQDDGVSDSDDANNETVEDANVADETAEDNSKADDITDTDTGDETVEDGNVADDTADTDTDTVNETAEANNEADESSDTDPDKNQTERPVEESEVEDETAEANNEADESSDTDPDNNQTEMAVEESDVEEETAEANDEADETSDTDPDNNQTEMAVEESDVEDETEEANNEADENDEGDEYSNSEQQSPETEKSNEQSLNERQENQTQSPKEEYDEYLKNGENENLEYSSVEPARYEMTNAQNINGIDASGEKFWEHHNNEKTDYMELASKLPDVQEKLNSGMSIDEIRKDDSLRDCVNAYYDPDKMVKVEKYKDTYVFQDDGRHRIAAAQELGYDVPVQVVSEAKAKDNAIDGTNFENVQNDGGDKQNLDTGNNQEKSLGDKAKDFFSNLFGQKDEVSNDVIENGSDNIDKSKIDDVKNIDINKLSETDKDKIYDTVKEHIAEKYGDKIDLGKLDEIAEHIKIADTSECKKAYEANSIQTYNDNVVGFYNPNTKEIYIDAPKHDNINDIVATVDHEALHYVSDGGMDGEISGRITGHPMFIDCTNINEGITELYAKRDMEDMGIEYNSGSYDEQVEIAEKLEDAIGADTMREAYLTNNPELVREKFDKAFEAENGYIDEFNGAFEDLNNSIDEYIDACNQARSCNNLEDYNNAIKHREEAKAIVFEEIERFKQLTQEAKQ